MREEILIFMKLDHRFQIKDYLTKKDQIKLSLKRDQIDLSLKEGNNYLNFTGDPSLKIDLLIKQNLAQKEDLKLIKEYK